MHWLAVCLLILGGCTASLDELPSPEYFSSYQADAVVITSDDSLIHLNMADRLSLRPGFVLELGTPRRGKLKYDTANQRFIYRFGFRRDSTSPGRLIKLRDTIDYRVCYQSLCKNNIIIFAGQGDSCRLVNFSVPLIGIPGQRLAIARRRNLGFCSSTRLQMADADGITYNISRPDSLIFNLPSLPERNITVKLRALNPTDTSIITLNIRTIATPDYCRSIFVTRKDTIGYRVGYYERITLSQLLANDTYCPGDVIPASFQLVAAPRFGSWSRQVDSTQIVPGVYFYYSTSFQSMVDSLSYTLQTYSGAVRRTTLIMKRN